MFAFTYGFAIHNHPPTTNDDLATNMDLQLPNGLDNGNNPPTTNDDLLHNPIQSIKSINAEIIWEKATK